MKVYLQSLGCRLNQSELESLARQFVAAAHVVVGDPAVADVCVINTCAVTAGAERKSRRCTRLLARANPGARIALVGCYATLAPQFCADLPGVTWVISNDEKERVVEIVAPSFLQLRSEEGRQDPHFRTRGFVKVQDGCDNHCTYCIVRLLRGSGRSRPVDDVVSKVQVLVDGGCQEAVLTGVNLGAYGRDLELSNGLSELIRALLDRTDLPRLRLSSLEPWDLDEAFLDLWKDSRLCRQLHLPLQAGCDDTLRRMGRPITTAQFSRLVETARAAVPDMAVTTDIIVGFPGEDDTDFCASYDFVAATPFARLHVFPYSSRPDTPAARLPDQIDRKTRESRARAMRELGNEQALRFRQRFVGREMMVLFERRRRDGLCTGLTDNYLRVRARGDDLHNRLIVARLHSVQDGYLLGEVIAE